MTVNTFEIKECSPIATKLIKSRDDNVGTSEPTHRNTVYPFQMLKIGECFTIPYDMKVNEIVLRNTASLKGKKQGKKFSVIKHDDYQCFEIARIA